MTDAFGTIGVVLGATLSALALLGLAIKFVLVPYLKEHLIDPLQRTEHAVRANGHKDPENPTMRDQFSDVLHEIRGLRDDVAEVKSDVAAVKVDVADVKDDVADVKGDLTKHLNWSSEETSRLWSSIKRPR